MLEILAVNGPLPLFTGFYGETVFCKRPPVGANSANYLSLRFVPVLVHRFDSAPITEVLVSTPSHLIIRKNQSILRLFGLFLWLVTFSRARAHPLVNSWVA